jgi:hypothetical protein
MASQFIHDFHYSSFFCMIFLSARALLDFPSSFSYASGRHVQVRVSPPYKSTLLQATKDDERCFYFSGSSAQCFQDESEGSESAAYADRLQCSSVRGIRSVVCANFCQFCIIKCSMMEGRMSIVRLLTNTVICLCCVLGNLIECRQRCEFQCRSTHVLIFPLECQYMLFTILSADELCYFLSKHQRHTLSSHRGEILHYVHPDTAWSLSISPS